MINFPKISSQYDRSFYYDSYPPENAVDYENKRAQKEALFENINLTPNFRVNYGASKNWNKRRGVEQKGVDVLLAIEVFQHAVSGNMDIASIVTGDLDFLPLLEALSRTRVKTEIQFDPNSISIELIHAADQVKPLTMIEFLQWTRIDTESKISFNTNSSEAPGDLLDIETGKIGNDDIFVGKSPSLGKFVAFVNESKGYKSCLNKEVLVDSFFRLPNYRATF